MIVAVDVCVMLLTEAKFKTFTPKEICDATKSTEVLEPQDHGFMYGHGFEDLDGHIWELIYMET